MRSVADMSRQELEQFLSNEIASARSEARPISRLTLSRSLLAAFPMNPHEAEKLVDRYCDDKAPGVPTYLSSEFGTPYLKVLAVLNVAIGIGLSITAAVTMRKGGGYGFLIWLGFGVLFLVGAAFCWLQSVRPLKEKGKKVTANGMPTTTPNVSFPNDPIKEPTATGSFHSRS